MKKIISTCIALMVSAACSISAFAMEVPTNTTIQDLNGVRQYITSGSRGGGCLDKDACQNTLALSAAGITELILHCKFHGICDALEVFCLQGIFCKVAMYQQICVANICGDICSGEKSFDYAVNHCDFFARKNQNSHLTWCRL